MRILLACTPGVQRSDSVDDGLMFGRDLQGFLWLRLIVDIFTETSRPSIIVRRQIVRIQSWLIFLVNLLSRFRRHFSGSHEIIVVYREEMRQVSLCWCS